MVLEAEMSERTYKVGAVARIGKVTVRTLHHYDEIGLLTPSGRNRAGYRLYTAADIERLQQIRFHRELGMALEDIRYALDAPGFDSRVALRQHRARLARRLTETAALVATIDRMLSTREGDAPMTAEELFEGFKQEQLEAEAEERWGGTPSWEEAQRRTRGYGPDDWKAIKAESKAIVEELAARQAAGDAPDSEAAMAAAEQHRQHIDRWFYACSLQMHAALAEMYVTDHRFAESFDKHADGLSSYVFAAIKSNADRS